MIDISIGFEGLTTTVERLAQLSLAAQVFGSSSTTVRSDDPVATYMEQGTRAHDIYPRDKTPGERHAVFWEGAAHPWAHVHHPGTSPNPFLDRGMQAASGPIEALIVEKFEQVLSGGGSNYTKIMDDAGKLLLAAVQHEAPVRTGKLRASLYTVNG